MRSVVALAGWLLMLAPLYAINGEVTVVAERGDTIREIVVTGSNGATTRSSLPYNVSVIGGDELLATGSSELLTAISGMVPSLFVSSRNILGFGVSTGGSGAITIRGVGGSPTNAVLMMVDGEPQYAGIYSHPVADCYSTASVDHVEVLRGPASVLYGSNAMGGVVNVITRQAANDGVTTTLSSQYGSYNTWLTSATNAVSKGRFSSFVSLCYDHTDGVDDGFDFKRWNVYAKLAYRVSDAWKARIDYSVMKFVGDDPVYATLDDPESTDVYHQDITRGDVSMALSNSYGPRGGTLRLYYSYGNHYIDDPDHFHSLDDRTGVVAYQSFSPWRHAAATAGFDFDTYTGKIPMSGGTAHSEGSLTTISRKRITEYSPYICLSQSLFHSLLSIDAGLRMSNSNRFGTHWIPQAGIVVTPGKGWTLKASAAKGFRNPSFRELYLYRTANADLEPESMMNYEVTVGKRFSRWMDFELTAYYSKGSDMIETVDMQNVNTGSFTNKGVELTANSHPLRHLWLKATYSYLHTSLDNLTAAPKNQYSLRLAWQALQELRVDAALTGVGGLYVSDTVDRQDYALLNLKITYSPFSWLDLTVTLDNITDAHYEINRGYTMPGFSAMGGFSLRL